MVATCSRHLAAPSQTLPGLRASNRGGPTRLCKSVSSIVEKIGHRKHNNIQRRSNPQSFCSVGCNAVDFTLTKLPEMHFFGWYLGRSVGKHHTRCPITTGSSLGVSWHFCCSHAAQPMGRHLPKRSRLRAAPRVRLFQPAEKGMLQVARVHRAKSFLPVAPRERAVAEASAE